MKKDNITIPKFFLGAFKIGHRTMNKPFIDESLSYKLLKNILASKIKTTIQVDETMTNYEKWCSNYSDKKSIQELEYLTQFNNEYYSARAPKAKEPLFNTPELIKIKNDMHNSRRRDIMTREYDFLSYLTPNHNDINKCNCQYTQQCDCLDKITQD